MKDKFMTSFKFAFNTLLFVFAGILIFMIDDLNIKLMAIILIAVVVNS